jgi:Tol biopolymer transport system component
MPRASIRISLTAVFATLSIGTILFTISHKTYALQTDLLQALQARDLALVEVASFRDMRVLQFNSSWFETRKAPAYPLLLGVSREGDQLIFSAQTGYAGNNDYRNYITTLNGQTIAVFRPMVHGMAEFAAELSPDRRVIAFLGSVANAPGVGAAFGLHLLDESGSVRTLVETIEAETPSSIGWSTDGHTIVYDSSNRIFLYHMKTNTSSFFADGSYPTWSPDGLWIAYQRPGGAAALVSPDRVHSKKILDNVRIAAGLRWSPDSSYLLFTDVRGIKVLDIARGTTATVYVPIDQYTESRLRWVRGLPN